MMHHDWDQTPDGTGWVCRECGVHASGWFGTVDAVREHHRHVECPAALRRALDYVVAEKDALARKSRRRGQRIKRLQDILTVRRAQAVASRWAAPMDPDPVVRRLEAEFRRLTVDDVTRTKQEIANGGLWYPPRPAWVPPVVEIKPVLAPCAGMPKPAPTRPDPPPPLARDAYLAEVMGRGGVAGLMLMGLLGIALIVWGLT